MNEHDDLGRELRETRAEPAPEFARALDERAAGWLRERPRRRMPSLRIAIPALGAAAAAAVVIALAVSGGGDDDGGSSKLEVAVVANRGAAEALSGGGSQLDLQKEPPASRAAEGAFAAPQQTDLEEGEPVVARYFFTAATDARIELAGRKAALRIPAGAGRIEISTDGIPAGAHELVITVRSIPPVRQRIEIED